MLLEALPHLRCPSQIVKTGRLAPCGGHLNLSDGIVAIRADPSYEKDILEAVVTCTKCGTSYPVILGVLVLVPDIDAYIRNNYHYLCRAIAEGAIRGQSASKEMIEFLEQRGGRTGRPAAVGEWDQDLPWVLSRYIQAHYGTLCDRLKPSSGAWSTFVTGYEREQAGPYDVLLGMLTKFGATRPPGSAQVAIDVGCSVGRMAHRVAPLFGFVYGVDLSFGAILAARRLVRGSPDAMKEYRVLLEGGEWDEVAQALVVERRANVEFFVASATALPFAEGYADCLVAVNLLDVLAQPEKLFGEAARVLGYPGMFLMADPYCWRGPVAAKLLKNLPGETSDSLDRSKAEKFVELALRHYGFAIVCHEYFVPWLLRHHARHWEVFLCHCICATR